MASLRKMPHEWFCCEWPHYTKYLMSGFANNLILADSNTRPAMSSDAADLLERVRLLDVNSGILWILRRAILIGNGLRMFWYKPYATKAREDFRKQNR